MLTTLGAAFFLVTALGNTAAPNSNLDASPPPATAPAQLSQPGPPQDATIQHGVVDPRGTDAMPYVVRVVAMPPAGLPRADETAPHGPPPDDGASTLAWIAIAFGVLQSLLMIGVIWFVMQAANGSRRVAEAVERALHRDGDTTPVVEG